MLSESEKHFLLDVARTSIEAAVKRIPSPKSGACPEAVLRPSGAFVTLHRENELRGCIGYLDAAKPMVETVREVAPRAALEDPRFEPVSPEELQELEVEISVISPMKRIRDITEIEVGKHGLLVECGMYRGLLLPQVATEYGWGREQFLNQTARKAGLPPSEWKSPEAKISVFTAEVFSEHSLAEERT